LLLNLNQYIEILKDIRLVNELNAELGSGDEETWILANKVLENGSKICLAGSMYTILAFLFYQKCLKQLWKKFWI
jgi:hypothetical protein